MTLAFLSFLFVGSAVVVACGVGPLLLIRGGFPAKGISLVGLAGTLGLAVMGTCAALAFYLELAPAWVIPLSLLASALLAAALVWRSGRRDYLNFLKPPASLGKDSGFGIILLAALAVIFQAGYLRGFHQPVRLGIDEVGYATTATYLYDGGTKSSAEKLIRDETLQPSLEYALNANITAVSFQANVAGEFLLKAHRFSYPMILAGLARVFFVDTFTNFQFCFLAVALFLAAAMTVWFCRDVIGFPDLASKIAAIALLLNSNQLNILFEGQHAQIAILPLLILFFATVFFSRRETIAPWRNWRIFLLIMAAGGGLFVLYSDCFIALVAFGVILLGQDILAGDWAAVRADLLLVSAILAGMLMQNLYFLHWITFITKHLANLGSGHGGFWQPYWAAPAEILGYLSIYKVITAALLERDLTNLFWVVLISGISIFFVFIGPMWKTGRERRFWLSPILVCGVVLIKTRWIDGFHNYGYMKTYVLMLTPIVILHFGSLYCAAHRFAPKAHKILAATLALAIGGGFIIQAGVNDCIKYRIEATSLPPDVAKLRRLDRELDFSKVSIMTNPPGGLACAMLGGYIPFNWLNLQWADKKIRPHLDDKVLVLRVGDTAPVGRRAQPAGRVMFSGRDLRLIDTGLRVRDLQLPESDIVADKQTTSIEWSHKQDRFLNEFLERFFQEANEN